MRAKERKDTYMPTPDDYGRRSNLSAKEWEIISTVHESGVINFDQLGKLVAKVSPALFDPGVVADDYIAKVYSSCIQVYHVGQQLAGLESVESLRAVRGELREDG
jgi:hypothetical protein